MLQRIFTITMIVILSISFIACDQTKNVLMDVVTETPEITETTPETTTNPSTQPSETETETSENN